MPSRVTFENVSKSFRVRNRSDSLRDAVPRLLKRLVGGTPEPSSRFVALDGVSFHVDEAEVVGLVGGNGAGKSTSLRLAAGVYKPDSGRVDLRGRVSALIELSAGFHPDLSGRENIHLVGALHGLRRAEIAARIDEMVEFADVGEFLESPVRTYSTGMAVRLGFAVAAHVPSEILLVDEVLAVGDVEFRAKCLRRMARRKEDGASIVFVSHNLSMMEQFCDRLIFVHRGQVAAEGSPPEVIAQYRRTLAAERHADVPDARTRPGTQDLQISDVVLNGGTGELEYGGSLSLRAKWSAHETVCGARLTLRFHTVNGVLCAAAPSAAITDDLVGEGTIHVEIPELTLLPGAYDVSIEASDASGLVLFDLHNRLYQLTVDGIMPSGAEGVFAIASNWRVER